MSKCIDAEKLIAEINKIRHDWLDDSTGLEVGEFGAELGAAESILDSIDDIIDSLQQEQPEVDLEKEIKEHAERMPMSEFTHESEVEEFIKWAKEEFRHFYELGFDAGKKK